MDEVKVRLGFYGSTPDYWPVLEMHGYGDLGPKLRQMTREGKWDALADEIPDDLVRLFAAVGVHGEVKKGDRGALRRRCGYALRGDAAHGG